MWLPSRLLFGFVLLVKSLSSECPSCPPGFGVRGPCNDSSSDSAATASCEPCTEEAFFSALDEATGIRRCQPCQQCGTRGHILVACNATDDTVCGCSRDSFWDGSLSRCRRCSPCPHGQGAVKPCTDTEDTVCGPCPNGTFSRLVSSSRGCQPCSKCNPNLRVAHTCTRIQDTVCADPEGPISRPARRSPVPLPSEDSGLGVLPVYCALLVAIVLAVVAYVALRQWLPSSSNSDEDDQKTATAETQLQDLPMQTRREVEALLDVRRSDWRDWRGLALELGYSSFKIAQLEYKGRQRKGPTRHLLMQLSKHDGVTLNRLVTILLCLGRIDVARVLQPNLEKSIGKRGLGIMV